MKFLIVTQYFWPETFIVNDLADMLAAKGHQVTVFTGKPNYPEGRLFPGYQIAGITHEERPSGVRIHRVPLRPRGAGGEFNLTLNYFSFLLSGLLRFPRLARGHRYDVIFFFAPSPMTSAITAIPLKLLKKAHLAIWVQDLWPESLSATGYVSNRAALFLVRQVVRWIYRAADTLLIQSQAFFAPIAKLADTRKIAYLPNFYPAQKTTSSTDRPVLETSLRETLRQHFCIVFSGNLGTAQSLDTVLDAASLVADIPELKIILVGSGSQSSWLESQIIDRNLDNVLLTGRLPVAQMPELYDLADGLLVTLRDEEVFTHTVPSKVQGYLASGRPVLAAINGETARIIEEAGAGFCAEAENAEALAHIIRKLYHLPSDERIAMGERGRDYFQQHFEIEAQINRLVDLLQQRIDLKQD